MAAVQELHMIADESRGLSLELSLTKLLLCKHGSEMQIIGMSATMGGDVLLTRALIFTEEAHLYCWYRNGQHLTWT